MEQAVRESDQHVWEAGSYPHHVQLLAGRFRYPRRRLFFAKARFFGDRIELSGWRIRGWHRRSIPLTQIAGMEYPALEDGANLTLFLDQGEVVHLHVEEAHRWRELFENWLCYQVQSSVRLMDKVDQAAQAG